MVKTSLGINILAVLPLASNATSAVFAEMIAPAIIAKTASKYFRIVSVFYGRARPISTANTNEESSNPVSTMRISGVMPNPVRKVREGLARNERTFIAGQAVIAAERKHRCFF
jgi:hypothetical protein